MKNLPVKFDQFNAIKALKYIAIVRIIYACALSIYFILVIDSSASSGFMQVFREVVFGSVIIDAQRAGAMLAKCLISILFSSVLIGAIRRKKPLEIRAVPVAESIIVFLMRGIPVLPVVLFIIALHKSVKLYCYPKIEDIDPKSQSAPLPGGEN